MRQQTTADSNLHMRRFPTGSPGYFTLKSAHLFYCLALEYYNVVTVSLAG